jgi:hypothetical protein
LRVKGRKNLMPRLKPAPGYVTASEAIEMLNISDATLSTYVKKGWLKRYGPPERKHKFYKESEIKAVIASRNRFDEYQEWIPAFLSNANPEDMPAIADIDERTFNEKGENAEPRETYINWISETYLRWMRKNSEIFFVLRNTQNKIVGFSSILPIKKDIMDQFVNGKIKMSDISPDDIELFKPGKSLHMYIIAICVDPSYNAIIKHRYGARMISGLFAFFLELAQRGVEIETITARNQKNKPDGKRLLQRMGIPQLRSPVPNIHLFSVKVADSGYPELIEYSNTLAEWKQKHQKD